MKRRVLASEQTRKRIEDLISGRGEGVAERSRRVKLAAQLIIEEALEGVEHRLGRGYYARAGREGHRNGYRGGKLDSAAGRIA